MNRDDKRRLKKAVQAYDRNLRKAYYSFESELCKMHDEEQEKIDSLPSSFESSSLAEKLSDNVDMIDDVLGKAEEIMNTLDEILLAADVSSGYNPMARNTEIAADKKDESFHALISSSLLKRLKEESSSTGLSMNEILNQALIKALSD